MKCKHCDRPIDEHGVGKQTDTCIAAVVFHAEFCPIHRSFSCCGRSRGLPSLVVDAAFRILDQFFAYEIGFDGSIVICKISKNPIKSYVASADNVPLAICRAALYAVSDK
jgi:hypothetical protein